MSNADRVSVWRVTLFLAVVYIAIRLAIPGLIRVGVPFELRALLLALLPYLGYRVGPYLFVRR